MTFFACFPAGIMLILVADGAAGRTAASIYFGSLLAVFGTSAAYHRLAHTPRARMIMQRLDHSMIFLLIAGTYVPICLVALPARWGIPILCVVGGLGAIGMAMKLSGKRRLHVYASSLYLIMGWVAVAAAPALVDHLSAIQLGLVVGRRTRLHRRISDPDAAPARPVAADVRVPRDLAHLHDRRCRAALRGDHRSRAMTGANASASRTTK